MAITERLAAFAATARYDDLPTEVVDVVKRIALDTLGTALAGTTLGSGCAEVERVVRGAGGAAESRVIGFGTKASALTAKPRRQPGDCLLTEPTYCTVEPRRLWASFKG